MKQNSIDLDEQWSADIFLENMFYKQHMFVCCLTLLIRKFSFVFLDFWKVDRTSIFTTEIEVHGSNNLYLSQFYVLVEWFELKRQCTQWYHYLQTVRNLIVSKQLVTSRSLAKKCSMVFISWNSRSFDGFQVVESRPMSRKDRFDEFPIVNRL